MEDILVPTSGSTKYCWTHEAALAVMKQLCEQDSVQYIHLREEFGEDVVNQMIKEHFLVYQPLPSVVNTHVEDPSKYPILTSPSPAHLRTLRKYFGMKDTFSRS